MTRPKRSETRTDLKKLLSNLDERWVRAASRQICDQLIQLLGSDPLAERKNILGWTSFFPGEIELSALISEMVEGRNLYLPRSHPDATMDFISIGRDWTEEVEPGLFGILEPTDDAGTPFESTSQGADAVVLVPGVAFDRIGNRIGRGKGYYDRFLGKPSMKHAVKIGICWELQLVDRITTESHDIPVDYVCHEEGVITTSL